MLNSLNFSGIPSALPFLLSGLLYSLQLTAIAFAGGIFLGTLLATGRLSTNNFASLFCSAYVNFMRSVPLVLVLFWFFLLVPLALQALAGAPRPITIGPDKTAIITFVLFEAAYFCEIVRSGILGVGAGQKVAGSSLGLSEIQTYVYVILPQAFRNMTPVLLTQTIILFQDTSLVYVLSATDFFTAAAKVAQRDAKLIEMYTFVAVVYFIICFLLSRAVNVLQSRIAIKR